MILYCRLNTLLEFDLQNNQRKTIYSAFDFRDIFIAIFSLGTKRRIARCYGKDKDEY